MGKLLYSVILKLTLSKKKEEEEEKHLQLKLNDYIESCR